MRVTGRSERGAAIVEMALVMPLLLILVFGIVEFGRAFMTDISVTHAAREGARAYAITRGSDDASAAQSAAIDAAKLTVSGAVAGRLVFAFTDCEPGTGAEVTITYPDFDFLIPFVPLGNLDLSSTGAMRCGG
ncbi:MAG: pilus assembly protein [Actinomycetia bacterium]|nr:pilus assembly protein [Actinomycetes bacterium]